MVALFDQRHLIDVVSGARATVNSGTPFVSQDGHALDYSGTANTQYAHQTQYAVTGAITIVALIQVDALSNFGGIVSKQQSSTQKIPFELRLGASATDAAIDFVRGDTGARQHYGASNALAAGYVGALVVTYPTGAMGQTDGKAYTRNGTLGLTVLASAGTGNATDDGTSPVWIGRRRDGATQFDGRIFYTALFNQELAPREAQSIVENPWQLFAPRRIWVPQAAITGLPTLSLPTYTPGSLTATGFRPRVTAT